MPPPRVLVMLPLICPGPRDVFLEVLKGRGGHG
jgi:hypothetical protein